MDAFESVLPPTEEAAAKGWQPQGLPAYPESFEQGAFTLPAHSKKLSEIVNPHAWDERIRFVEDGHEYYLDGIRTGGSVTGLMEPYSEKFDPDAACASMRKNAFKWPNPKYVRALPSDAPRYRDVLEAVTECHEEGRGFTTSLVHPVVDALPKLAVQLEVAIASLEFGETLSNVQADEVAKALRRLRDEAAAVSQVGGDHNGNRLPPEYVERLQDLAATAVLELTMTDAEIKLKWERDGARAANEGTWTHLQLELALNRDACYKSNPEFKAFSVYVEKVLAPMGVKVWRTEFELCAPEEDLAGSVDFIGIKPNGHLFVADWKRTRDLRAHMRGYRRLKAPLSHLDDCKGVKYCLQLNIYAYILEKYYGLKVDNLQIVCVHPELDGVPFVYEAPRMDAEVAVIMAAHRQSKGDAILARMVAALEGKKTKLKPAPPCLA